MALPSLWGSILHSSDVWLKLRNNLTSNREVFEYPELKTQEEIVLGISSERNAHRAQILGIGDGFKPKAVVLDDNLKRWTWNMSLTAGKYPKAQDQTSAARS